MPAKLFSAAGLVLLHLLPGFALLREAHAQRFDWQTFAGSAGGPGLNDGPPSHTRFSTPQTVIVDASGNIYTADTNNHSIRRTGSDGITSTLAGQSGKAGSNDGTGTAAHFTSPRALAATPAGWLIVADTGNHTIRRIAPDGVVTTLAGSPGVTGNTDGSGGSARFNAPRGLTVGVDGTIYVADSLNHTIRRITPDGMVSTLAGAAGVTGRADGAGRDARFLSPRGVALGPDGSLFVTDSGNHTIRRISPAGEVTTLAGQAGLPGTADGSGSAAQFRLPTGLVTDAAGQIYVADSTNQTIRRISPAGAVLTIGGMAGSAGYQDGPQEQARFRSPAGIALSPDGRIIVADSGNHALRALSPAGLVSTIAGSPRQSGSTDGAGSAALFNLPAALAQAPDGSLAVADEGNHLLRRITTLAEVSPLTGAVGVPGLVNGTLAEARFNGPAGLCYGPDGSLYVGDTQNRLIRLITPAGDVSVLAGTFAPLPGAAGIPAFEQRLYDARGIAVDQSGNIYVADAYRLRRIQGLESFVHLAGSVPRVLFTPPSTYITFWDATVRGQGDGRGASAIIRQSKSPVCDSAGNIYFADAELHTIRRCTPAGQVTTLAGTAKQSGAADGTGTAARFSAPAGLALAPDGTLYVADSGNHLIRRVSRTGVVTTIGGRPGYAGTGAGRGAAAQFANPTGIIVDATGALLVADRDNHRIVRGQFVSGPHLVVEFALTHLTHDAASTLPGMTPPGVPSQPVSVVLHNTGTDPLRLDTISLEGGDVSHYTLTAPAAGTVLAPDTSVSLTLQFTPPGLGYYRTTLRIQSQDPEQPDFRLHLTATGNNLPSCPAYYLTARAGDITGLAALKILARATDADGHALSVTGATTRFPAGPTATVSEGTIYYHALAGQTGTDEFYVTITDSLGGQIQVPVYVTLTPQDGTLPASSTNGAQLTRLEDGQMRVTFHGIPGRNYRVQRSADLLTWESAAYLAASPAGVVEWTDAAPLPDSGYYRLTLP